jgi:hypothetical protein
MKLIFSFLLILVSFSTFAQSKVTLSGYITDAKNGEAMSDVKIYIPSLKLGALSNSYGFYSLTVVPGKYAVEYRSMTYGSEVREVDLTKSTVLTLELGSKVTDKNEVVANMKKTENVTSTKMGQIELQMDQIKIPATGIDPVSRNPR